MRLTRLLVTLLMSMGLIVGCGGASAGVDDDPGTEDPDVGVSVGGDATEGEAGVDVDVGDDDDPDDQGEVPDDDDGVDD